MPSHPGICLWASQFRRGRASRSHPCATAETVRSDLFWLSPTGTRLGLVSHSAAICVHRLLGLPGFSDLMHATGRLQTERSALGHGETHLDQGSYAFPRALGAQTFLEGNHRPEFPDRFGCIQDSRAFCQQFVQRSNKEHRHSGLPHSRPRWRTLARPRRFWPIGRRHSMLPTKHIPTASLGSRPDRCRCLQRFGSTNRPKRRKDNGR